MCSALCFRRLLLKSLVTLHTPSDCACYDTMAPDPKRDETEMSKWPLKLNHADDIGAGEDVGERGLRTNPTNPLCPQQPPLRVEFAGAFYPVCVIGIGMKREVIRGGLFAHSDHTPGRVCDAVSTVDRAEKCRCNTGNIDPYWTISTILDGPP